MRSYTKKAGKIDLEDFKQIKVLQEHGFNANQIHEILGWGEATIKITMKYDNFGDYQAFLDEKYARQKQSLQGLTPQSQSELDASLEEWKEAFDNRLSYIDNNLAEVKQMIQDLNNKSRGFWK